ncbi:unnamed protein product, partial [Brassica rapa subsp. trilocularis]
TSSQADQQSHDVPATANSTADSQDALISELLSFQEEMDCCDAEEEATPLTCAALADLPVPVEESDVVPDELVSAAAEPAASAIVEPSSSSAVPTLSEVEPLAAPTDVELAVAPAEVDPAAVSKPPPPVKRVIVLGLLALSAMSAAPAKGRKRPCANPDAPKRKRCTKGPDAGPSSSKAPSSGLMSQHRAKFVSLIDGVINECGSDVEHLAKELAESQERSAQFEGKLKVIEDAHSAEVSQFEARISDLERDLGKTASSLLKAKDAKKAKALELRRLQRKIKSI